MSVPDMDNDAMLEVVKFMEPNAILNLCHSNRNFQNLCKINKTFICKTILNNLGFERGIDNSNACDVFKIVHKADKDLASILRVYAYAIYHDNQNVIDITNKNDAAFGPITENDIFEITNELLALISDSGASIDFDRNWKYRIGEQQWNFDEYLSNYDSAMYEIRMGNVINVIAIFDMIIRKQETLNHYYHDFIQASRNNPLMTKVIKEYYSDVLDYDESEDNTQEDTQDNTDQEY
jgi:hypothetical protein